MGKQADSDGQHEQWRGRPAGADIGCHEGGED